MYSHGARHLFERVQPERAVKTAFIAGQRESFNILAQIQKFFLLCYLLLWRCVH